MQKKTGGLWAEKHTKDWFWIRKRGTKYFSSVWITCVDAVRILKGKMPIPKARFEVEDISVFEPVPKGVIKLLTRAVNGRKKAGRGSRIGY